MKITSHCLIGGNKWAKFVFLKDLLIFCIFLKHHGSLKLCYIISCNCGEIIVAQFIRLVECSSEMNVKTQLLMLMK